MSTLLQEIISVYPLLNPPELTPHASNRVCNALALLQCVASHPETRDVFLKAHIPLFLYPFLNTTSKSRPFEYLRLTSLGVIGALVKSDSPPTIEFLLTTEIIPLCLRIMETGSELSKVCIRRNLSNCRPSPFLFCKKSYWMIRVYSISVEHMNDFWLLHKCSVSW
jgi:CCR4-NOT transcription complex subunit 9